nr:hypothetical protein [Candidatus Gracilibacteria bacterium]
MNFFKGTGLLLAGLFAGSLTTKNNIESGNIVSDEINNTKLRISIQVVGNLKRQYQIYYDTKGNSYKLDEFKFKGTILAIPSKKIMTKCLIENQRDLEKTDFSIFFNVFNFNIKNKVAECLGYN